MLKFLPLALLIALIVPARSSPATQPGGVAISHAPRDASCDPAHLHYGTYKDIPYKKVRPLILKAGYRPAPFYKCEDPHNYRCDMYPEIEYCDDDMEQCHMRFRDKAHNVLTVNTEHTHRDDLQGTEDVYTWDTECAAKHPKPGK